MSQSSSTFIAGMRADTPHGHISLKLFCIDGEPTRALAVWKDHENCEIRAQTVDIPNTRTWVETTRRHMMELHPNVQTPARLIPRPNKNKPPYV